MSRTLSDRPLWSIRFFLLMAIIYVIGTAVLVSLTEKTELHLAINEFYRNDFLDFFFQYWTELGAGLINGFIIILVSFAFPKPNRLGIILLGFMTLLLCGIFAALFKQVFFADMMRPIAVYPDGTLDVVEGVKLARKYTFPSGHTMAGFAFFAYLSFLYNKKIFLQILFGIGAILVAFSRVYLSFHFIEDTLAGATLGIVCWYLGYSFVNGILSKIWPKVKL